MQVRLQNVLTKKILKATTHVRDQSGSKRVETNLQSLLCAVVRLTRGHYQAPVNQSKAFCYRVGTYVVPLVWDLALIKSMHSITIFKNPSGYAKIKFSEYKSEGTNAVEIMISLSIIILNTQTKRLKICSRLLVNSFHSDRETKNTNGKAAKSLEVNGTIKKALASLTLNSK